MRDMKVFEIALDDANYDEESENEMIQPQDLADVKSLAEDEGKYEPLHSHVKYYNERNTESEKQYPNIFLYLRPHTKEIFNLEGENKPFVAGFKHNLDKVNILLEERIKRFLYTYIRLLKIYAFELVFLQNHAAANCWCSIN